MPGRKWGIVAAVEEEFKPVIQKPVVEASAGQKVMGILMRILGVLVFLPGAAYFGLLVYTVLPLGYQEFQGNTKEFLMFLAFAAGCLVIMVVGSLMASFGAFLYGSAAPGDGRSLVRLMAITVGRDLSLVLGASAAVNAIAMLTYSERVGVGLLVLLFAVASFVGGVLLSRRLAHVQKGERS